ncbi:uncharacterized protein LOC134235911, partial [Saccostrea cucullata]|uniref:uncharacterized protein LOC134235911 n=1 Tax=Saccostrea cuccullata TaxID=36930 RepID=UPI002ED212BC
MSTLNYPSTEETTNENRACRLLLGPCTDSLRDVLRHHVPPSLFSHVIHQHSLKLPRLTATQRSLILPQKGSYVGNYDDMDISLLYILLRNICNIPAHSKGWSNDPNSSDTSVSANIERIRFARNERGHSSSSSLPNSEFNMFWNKVRSAVVGIDSFLNNGNHFANQVDLLRSETMDPVSDKHYKEKLKQQAEEDRETRTRVIDLEKRFEKSKLVLQYHDEHLKQQAEEDLETRTRVLDLERRFEKSERVQQYHDEYLKQQANENKETRKMVDDFKISGPDLQFKIDTTRKMLNEFEKEIRSLFVKTRASEKVMEVLEGNRCVFLIGNPGDGKTTLAKHILVSLQKRGMMPIQILSFKNFYEKMPGCSKMVIFLDDVFGVRCLSKKELHYFTVQRDLIQGYLSNDDKRSGNMLIATLRNDIFRECENTITNSEFFKSSLFNMSGTDFKINRDEFANFVSTYALQDIILSVDEILEKKSLGYSIGIPLCMKILKNIVKNKVNIADIFEHPMKYLQEDIEIRIKEKEHKTAVLIYILLCGGSIETGILTNPYKDRKRKSKALQMMELEGTKSSMIRFHNSIKFYEGSYIEFDDVEDVYKFTHSSVKESIFLYMSQYYLEDIISDCEPSLLLPLYTSKNCTNAILIDTSLFTDLIDRINKILKGKKASEYKSVSLMSIWNDEDFRKDIMQNEEWKQKLVDSIDEKEDSMLVHFSGAGNFNCVKHLLSFSTEKQRYKSLNRACTYNHIDIVDLILETNVKYNLKTCFHAVQSGNIKMLFRFTDKVDLKHISFSHNSQLCNLRGGLLQEICLSGQNHLLEPVLERYPSLINVLNEKGGNVLHFVAYAGQIDIFAKLIKRGSDPYSRDYDGFTILHYACLNGKLDMVTYISETYPKLLTKGFDNYYGWPSLRFAALSGNIELYEYLVEKDLDVKRKEQNVKSVLHQCCRNGKLEMCKYLVNKHPEILEISDDDRSTVLHDAAWGGNVDVFNFLIDKGLDVKSTAQNGKTVLHQCCRNGKLEMCKYLVNKHPELLEISDNDRSTVLHDAAWGGNVDVFNFLIDKGLDVK